MHASPTPADLPAGASDGLPSDAQGILALAARSMFHLFSSISQGMFLVDRTGRIVWVNEGYQRFLPALGFESLDQFMGRTPRCDGCWRPARPT
jgi:PAS domain-containing protein